MTTEERKWAVKTHDGWYLVSPATFADEPRWSQTVALLMGKDEALHAAWTHGSGLIVTDAPDVEGVTA